MLILDETVAEILGSTVVAAGRRLGLALASPRGRKQSDIEVARWFDTYAITNNVPSQLSGWIAYDGLTAFLNDNSVQAIVYELLTVRLTDAPEAEVERLSKLFKTLGQGKLTAHEISTVFDFLDQEIADLVGRLSSADPDLLHRIRQDAYLGRIVAAIDRQTTALSKRSDLSDGRDFVVRYRQRAGDHHGRLQPPDFERRRLVPIAELYVPPTIIQLGHANPAAASPLQVDIQELAGKIHRTVLLGDPGGGKTTAAQVILQQHATDAGRPVPFLVTLREYASAESPERSVLHYIEHKLETFYQCSPPPHFLESILLSGAALVIFDGLDELMDTSRRSEISAIIENFCSEYPLTRVLVTSRVIGYDQARLDERQFECYQIVGFNSQQVAEYAQKWFTCQERVEPGEADSFLEESANAADLRSSPLMLALMCILYRGQGSIPRSRSAVYEQCASLLYHRWDASRKIHLELRARNFVEPALRYLAHWLLVRADTQPLVTEHELVSETTAYFRQRGEEVINAEQAAREFVGFCRGRLWVFSEAGTTRQGEALYTFTHRTFLEYFAAAYLASVHDKPEQLGRKIISYVARGEWDTVAQLAVQIKDRSAERGGDRIFQTLLANRRYRASNAVGNILGFLGRCTAFIEPAPATLRDLTTKAFAHMTSDASDDQLVAPLAWLMVSAQRELHVSVRRHLERRITDLVKSRDDTRHLLGLRLSLQLHNAPFAISQGSKAWSDWNLKDKFIDELVLAAAREDDIASFVVSNSEHVDQILSSREDILDFLFTQQYAYFLAIYWDSPVEVTVRKALSSNRDIHDPILSRMGHVLRRGSPPPRILKNVATGHFGHKLFFDEIFSKSGTETRRRSDNIGDPLSIAFALCVFAEVTEPRSEQDFAARGLLNLLIPYFRQRWGISQQNLPTLPVDHEWQAAFANWAQRAVDFTLNRDPS